MEAASVPIASTDEKGSTVADGFTNGNVNHVLKGKYDADADVVADISIAAGTDGNPQTKPDEDAYPENDAYGDEGAEPLAVDAVTSAQRRLDELAEMLYTYVGVIQRDAPPSARAPDEADEVAGDDALRADLLAKIPEYARDVVRASGDFSKAIDRIAKDVEAEIGDAEGETGEVGEANAGRQRALLVKAEEASVSAGSQLRHAANGVENLLAQVRDAISKTEF
jgi:Sec-independent protein translocase protein TatA